MNGPEMLVRALCNLMGVDLQKLAPQVIDTMNKIQSAEARLAAIEETCKNSAVALGRLEGALAQINEMFGREQENIDDDGTGSNRVNRVQPNAHAVNRINGPGNTA